MLDRLSRRATAYRREVQRLNRKCWLCFLSSALNGMSLGIFSVVFNLYILSLGIEADVLGRLLSAEPFAQALGSIPVGFLAETIGFKKSFPLIYSFAGLAKLMIRDALPRRRRQISLYPYLWGIDRFTAQQATVSLLVGLSVGLVRPFINLYFVYPLGTSLEFFGAAAALTLLPSTIATGLGPLLATQAGTVSAVTLLRFSIPLALVTLALTTQPLLGTIGYWCQRALFSVSQPLSFTFAMEAAHRKAKAAVSAWLNVSFWLGMG